MANIDKTINELWSKTKDSAETLRDIVRIRKSIFEAKAELKNIFYDLGSEVYLQNKKNDPQPEEIDDLIAAIDAKQGEIKILSDELYALQGNVKCESCGRLASVKFDFCPYCGEKLFNDPPAEEEETEEAVEEAVEEAAEAIAEEEAAEEAAETIAEEEAAEEEADPDIEVEIYEEVPDEEDNAPADTDESAE